MKIPYDCPRKRTDCRSLALIASDSNQSFFCCGENDGSGSPIEQDKYTTCFKGEYRDEISYSDKRDLVHNAAVLVQALAVIEKDINDNKDWSPWSDIPDA